MMRGRGAGGQGDWCLHALYLQIWKACPKGTERFGTVLLYFTTGKYTYFIFVSPKHIVNND